MTKERKVGVVSLTWWDTQEERERGRRDGKKPDNEDTSGSVDPRSEISSRPVVTQHPQKSCQDRRDGG